MSTPYDLAAAAEAALTPLLDGGSLDGWVIDIREPPVVDAARDAAALAASGLILITPEDETFKTLTCGTGTAQVGLALRVTLVQAGNGQYADRTTLEAKHAAREAVRETLLKRGALGLSDVAGASYEPEPAYDVAAADRGHRVSRQRFRYLTTARRALSG